MLLLLKREIKKILFLLFIHKGILEVLYCVLIESPEVLNIIQENHIKSIISLLDKHGRNHKVQCGGVMCPTRLPLKRQFCEENILQ